MLKLPKYIFRNSTFFSKVVFFSAILAIPATMFAGQVSSKSLFGAWFSYFDQWPYGVVDWSVNALALIGLAYIFIWAFRKIAVANESEVTKANAEIIKYRLFEDVPISLSGNDELGRLEFSKKLSKTVVLPPNASSLVLALEAPWGAGKSSALTLLRQQVEKHKDNPIVVSFNPWLATGHDRIFRAFFSQFSAALLEENERKLANNLVGFGENLEELLPGRARILPRIGLGKVRRILGRIPIIDLEAEKQRLSQAITETGRPLVVIIDDLDRLHPDDIKVVFQLIKAIADFPRVGYILAFDPEPIDRALSFGADSEKGRRFRDKIVQASVSLPRVPYSTRKTFFVSKIRGRLAAWQIALSSQEERILERAVPLILAALRTPRDVKRVINKTLISAENLKGEVNFADIVIFETLHAKYPKVADIIRSDPRVVDPADYGDDELSELQIDAIVQERVKKKPQNSRLSNLVSLYPDDRQILSGLLQFVFPSLSGRISDPEDYDAAGNRRIAVYKNLLKLLYLGLHGDLLSAQEAKYFLEHEEVRLAILGEAIDSESLPAWFIHLEQFVKSSSISEPIELIRNIAVAVSDFYKKSGIDSSGQSRNLMLKVLKTLDSSGQNEALRVLLGDPRTAAVGEEVLTPLLRDSGMWREGQYVGAEASQREDNAEFDSLSNDELAALKELWLSTISNLGIRKIILDQPNALSVLFRWGQLDDPPFVAVRAALNQSLEDSTLAAPFVGRFSPGIGLDGTEKLIRKSTWEILKRELKVESTSDTLRARFYNYYEHLYRNSVSRTEDTQ